MIKRYILIFIILLEAQNILCSIPLSERHEKTIEKSKSTLLKHKVKNKQEIADSLGIKNERNIVVFNDITESDKDFVLLNNNDYFEPPVVTIELLKSISEQQVIICTKSLIKNLEFLIGIWINFINQDATILQNEYSFLKKYSLSEIQKIKDMFINLNKVLLNYKDLEENSTSMISLNLNNVIKKVIEESNINEKLLFYIYMFGQYYENILKILKNYNIYEVNKSYLLLYPKSVNPINFSLFKKINLAEMFDVIDNVDNSNIEESFLYAITSVINTNLNTSLSDQDLNKKFFKWNVFIIGHGEISDFIVGTHNMVFKAILEYFNSYDLVNSVTVLSCFSGGKKIKEFFGHKLLSNNNSLIKNVQFPILFFGSFFSPVVKYSFLGNWQSYKEGFDKHDYVDFFDKIRQQDFFEALNLFASYDQIGSFTNYGAIKFPNTDWITVSDYKKNVFNISKIRVVTAYDTHILQIPDSKNIILMNTNVIPLEITINMSNRTEKNNCKFLPVFYMNQDYFISSLRLVDIKMDPINKYTQINKDRQIANILWSLFNIELIHLAEPINIFIKRVIVGKYQLNNLLIELDKNQLSFESLINPFKIVMSTYNDDTLKILSPDQEYLDKITSMKKTLEQSNTFLSDVGPDFIKKLESGFKAKQLPKLNPKAKEFISKQTQDQSSASALKIKPIGI